LPFFALQLKCDACSTRQGGADTFFNGCPCARSHPDVATPCMPSLLCDILLKAANMRGTPPASQNHFYL
jgi:hypothetical protein